MSTFPSVLSTISDPAATDRLNSPSHSSIESSQNDAVEKIETFVGTLSSAVGTLMYDIRAAASDGGGHVQGANKGGTGQTTFVKGDLLLAQSSSVISKLAIGANSDVLVADSSQQLGVRWGAARIAVSHASVSTFNFDRSSTMSVLSVNILGSTLGITGVIRATIPMIVGVGYGTEGALRGLVNFNVGYGTSSFWGSVATQTSVGAIMASFAGAFITEIIAASAVGAQRLISRGIFVTESINPSVKGFYRSSMIAEESSSTLGFTVSFRSTSDAISSSALGVLTDGYIIEKI